MSLLPTRRQTALFWQKAPSAVFVVLVKLPLGVILAFVLLAIVSTIAGLQGAELAADGLTNALVLVALVQGNMLVALIFFASFCFVRGLWGSRTALWRLATDLFSETPALMRLWRAVWMHAPTGPRLSPTRSFEYKLPAPVRELARAFTPGLTPQLE